MEEPVNSEGWTRAQMESVELPQKPHEGPLFTQTLTPGPAREGDPARAHNNPVTITYEGYSDESQLAPLTELIERDLSEPYTVYTYRYFLNNWIRLCILAYAENPLDGSSERQMVGVIIGRAEGHGRGHSEVTRGYIAMLAVDSAYRKMRIGSSLVQACVNEMAAQGCHEAVLETESFNKGSLGLYESMGFVREKRLPRYYLKGQDAFRLKLWLTRPLAFLEHGQ